MAIRVNGDIIDDAAIGAEFQRIKAQYERVLQVSCCERDPEFRGYAKEHLIGRVLMDQEAMRYGPTISEAEIDRAYVELMEEHGGEGMFLMNMGLGVSDTDFARLGIERSLRMERFLELLHPDRRLEDGELLTQYEKHRDLFMTVEEVRVCHITKSLRAAGGRNEVYEKMRALRRELLGGADFMQVAVRESDQEGQEVDLGFFERGSFMEEFETISFSLEAGELSPVFTTQLGFHICKVMERRPAVVRPFEEVKEQVLDVWRTEEREAKVREVVERLKRDGDIEDMDSVDVEAATRIL